MNLNETHYQLFISCSHTLQAEVGSIPRDWFQWVIAEGIAHYYQKADIGQLANKRLTRDELQHICKFNSGVDTLDCCISILAWGGMNRKYGREIFKCENNWLSDLEDLRRSEITPYEAYARLAGLRNDSKLKGMGPAYFTKLIYFLQQNPPEPGFIMDQWTASSVNLLYGRSVVETKMSNYVINGRHISYESVTDKNTVKNYQDFCELILDLSKRSNIDPSKVEEMLFSEGRNRGEWRNYVKSKRKSIS
jgi:hypothetical protein